MTYFLKNLKLKPKKVSTKTTNNKRKVTAKKGTKQQIPPLKFPETLFLLLQEIEEQGLEDVVSWQPDGRSFRVHKTERFVEEILPKYFRCSKMKSFQRQLNFYKFQRVVEGPMDGSYRHAKFIKGEEELAGTIQRLQDPNPMDFEIDTNHRNSEETVVSLLDDDEVSTSDSDDYPEQPSVNENLTAEGRPPGASRRDSLQDFLEEVNFESIEQQRSRESFTDGQRFSFVGKNFFFLPVEFTDIYG